MKTKKPRQKKPVYRTPREVYDKWIDALNSGRYRQGYGCLKFKPSGKSYQYCCLGVLCNLMNKDGGPSWGSYTNSAGDKIFDMLGGNEDIPIKLARYLKLSKTERYTLMNLNDGGRSFKGIAEHIVTLRDAKFP